MHKYLRNGAGVTIDVEHARSDERISVTKHFSTGHRETKLRPRLGVHEAMTAKGVDGATSGGISDDTEAARRVVERIRDALRRCKRGWKDRRHSAFVAHGRTALEQALSEGNLEIRTRAGIIRPRVEECLADRQVRQPWRRLDNELKAQATRPRIDGNQPTRHDRGRGTVGGRYAQESYQGPDVFAFAALPKRCAEARGQVRSADHSVFIGIRPTTTDHITVANLIDRVRITVEQLGTNPVDILKENEAVTVGVTG